MEDRKNNRGSSLKAFSLLVLPLALSLTIAPSGAADQASSQTQSGVTPTSQSGVKSEDKSEAYEPETHDPAQRYIKPHLPPDIDHIKGRPEKSDKGKVDKTDDKSTSASPESTGEGSEKSVTDAKAAGTEAAGDKSDATPAKTSDGKSPDADSAKQAADSKADQAAKQVDADKDKSDAAKQGEADNKDKSGTAPQVVPTRIGAGLDAKSYKLMNKGDWKAVALNLEKLTAKDNTPSRNNAWLAFAYMFLAQNDKLDALQKRVNEGKIPEDLSGYKLIIDAFAEVAHGKPEQGSKILAGLPKRHVNDAFANFALAAVAGKEGKAVAASDYCKRAVELDPQFAWGWRTLGYLQERWLNAPTDAEQSFEEALAIEPDQGEVRESLINMHLMRNDFDGAIDIAELGIMRNKKDGKAHFRLAQIYIQQWRLREALQELERAVALEPDNPSYYRSRATIKRYQGDVKDAIADQKKAVELSKDKAFEMSELANMYSQDGDSKKAVEVLQEAIKLDPTNKAVSKNYVALLLKERRYDDLVDEYKRALKLYPQDAALHFSLAETLLTVGNDEESIEEYKKAANLDVKDPRAHRRLGAIYMGKNDFDEAIKCFKRALDISATSVHDLYKLGICYAQEGTFLQAEAAFVTSLALQQVQGNASPDDPKREEIVRALAMLLVAEGRYADGAAQFQTVYSMTRETPRGPHDNYLLKQAQLLADRKDSSARDLIAAFDALPEEVRENCRHMLVQTLMRVSKPDLAIKEMAPISTERIDKDPRWLVFKPRAARLHGNYTEASALIDEAIKKVGDSEDKQALAADFLVEKAKILNAAQKFKDAEASAQAALEKVDKLPSSYLVLGQIKVEEGDPAAAIDFAKKSLEQNPYFTEAYMLLGDAYLKKGNAKEALDNYKKAAEIYPGLIDAHKALLRVYKALALKDEVKKEEQQVTSMEKTQ